MNENIYNKAIEHYGKSHQINKAIEELSELICALSRYNQSGEFDSNIIEEVVDCRIMLDQLEIIFPNDVMYDNIKNFKIKRLKENLK